MSQLKKIRETLDTTLSALSNLRSEVERLEAAFDAITGVVEVTQRIRRKQRQSKANGVSTAAKQTITAQILGALKGGRAMSFSELSAALPALNGKSIYNALYQLIKSRAVKRSGIHGRFSYKAAKR